MTVHYHEYVCREKQGGGEHGGEEEIEAAQQAKRVAELLSEELKKETSEHFLATQMQQRTAAMEPPLIGRLDAATGRRDGQVGDLRTRREERVLVARVFFDNESSFCADALTAVAAAKDELRVLREDKEQRLERLRPYYEGAEGAVEGIERETLTVGEYDLLRLPMGALTNSLRSIDILSTVTPHTACTAVSWLRGWISSEEEALAADIRMLSAMEEGASREHSLMASFPLDREGYERTARMWEEELLRLRRQKVVQNDLDERKKRLDALRGAKREELKAGLVDKEREERAKREVAVNAFRARLAKRIRKAVRSTRDAISNYRNNVADAMTEEEQRIARAIKGRTKLTLANRVEGVRNVYITASKREAALFEKEQDMLYGKGLPCYRPSCPLGGVTCLWVQSSFNSKDFITHLVMSHAKEGHHLNG